MATEHTGHEEQDSILKIALNLTIACFISGAIIAGTFAWSNPIAEQKQQQLKKAAMQELVHDVQEFNPVPGKTNWFAAMQDGQVVAYIVPGEGKGYGGKIEMLVAVNPQGKVMGINVLKMNETPGLGDKGGQEPFLSQFIAKGTEHLQVTKDPTNHEDIQALTGATITSRGVTNGVREAVENVSEFLGGK